MPVTQTVRPLRENSMELDKIITGDSAVVLQSFPPDCIDLTVTSPPYDNLRTYNGYSFDFETIARELFRVTKAGGVVVWVVGDQTINGSETMTSFKQALFFRECGFNLNDTMIWNKYIPGLMGKRYSNSFEYMFIFSKGEPKTFNPIMKKNSYSGKYRGNRRGANGTEKQNTFSERNVSSISENVWRIPVGGGITSTDGFTHPAQFPEALARDHILSWSNEGDVILDPFCVSGTTPKMAKVLSRHYVGIETSNEYVSLSEKRLLAAPVPLFGLERGLTPLAPDRLAALSSVANPLQSSFIAEVSPATIGGR